MTPAQLYNMATYDIELGHFLRKRALETLQAISQDDTAGEYQLAARRVWAKEMGNAEPKQ